MARAKPAKVQAVGAPSNDQANNDDDQDDAVAEPEELENDTDSARQAAGLDGQVLVCSRLLLSGLVKCLMLNFSIRKLKPTSLPYVPVRG